MISFLSNRDEKYLSKNNAICDLRQRDFNLFSSEYVLSNVVSWTIFGLWLMKKRQ